jgi:hypothetical protein
VKPIRNWEWVFVFGCYLLRRVDLTWTFQAEPEARPEEKQRMMFLKILKLIEET